MAVNRIWVLPAPNGTLSNAAKALILVGYGGIAFAHVWVTQHSVSDTWLGQGGVSDTWKEQQAGSDTWVKQGEGL